ncbi:EamA family transporter [Clostridium swellfunianum]|uniref:EamA family transporter n=1 Tax=Clostridium swellfunianum TaxID=1367462 RepID=UPI00202E1CFA|nr:EamA family transporter [Clostridium swellfunianum]MCM0647653.1 EamA family transporter [Clostridium swellfunianum]
MYRYILLCLIFTLAGAFGGLFFKKAATSSTNIIKTVLSPYLYIGGILYVIGAVLNIVVLKELKYTIVLPLTSITYVWTIIISYFILKEKITIKKLFGIAMILIGAIILGLYS